MKNLSIAQLHVLEELLSYISLHSKERGDYIILPKYVMYKYEYDAIKDLAKIVNKFYWDKVIELENEKK